MASVAKPDSYRVHGFQKPFAVEQYQAWTLVMLSFGFYYMNVAFLPRTLLLVFAISHAGITLLGLIQFCSVSVSDPVSPLVFETLESEAKKAEAKNYRDSFTILGPPEGRFCQVCRINRDLRTKHCNICHKCVVGFDHHCLFLNTCVGEKNYRQFFQVIFSAGSVLLLQIGLSTWIVVTVAMSESTTSEWVPLIIDNAAAAGLSRDAFLVLVGVTMVFPVGAFVAFSILIGFHLYIAVLGVTTYEWIISRRRIKEERRNKMQDEKRRKKNKERQEEERRQWAKRHGKEYTSSGGNPRTRPKTDKHPKAELELQRMPADSSV